MGVFLRGRWYWYRRMIDGHRAYRSLKIKRGQEAMLSGRMRQVDDEITAAHFGLPAPSRGAIRLSQYAASYIKQKAHNKSAYQLRHRLAIVWNIWPDLPLGQYSPAHVRELEAALFERKLKPATVNRYMELLRNLWNCAIEDGAATVNPIRSYQPFAEDGARRALSDDELGRILDDMRQRQEHPTNGAEAVIYDLALLSLSTGMRLGLILALRKDYIRGNTLVVPITSTKSKRRNWSRGERSKVMVLSDLAQEIIQRQKSKDEYVFPLSWRHPNFISRTIVRVREATGIKHFSFHSFRHTASTFISSNTSLAAAKAVLGHADLKTTLRYSHPEQSEQGEAVAKLGTHIEGLIHKRLINKINTDAVE